MKVLQSIAGGRKVNLDVEGPSGRTWCWLAYVGGNGYAG